jgi:site-specific DNA-methyltransferase (adenine-specific)
MDERRRGDDAAATGEGTSANRWRIVKVHKLARDVVLHSADCLSVLPTLADESVNLIVTDPPYEITDMGACFRELVRVLHPSGSMYVFGDKDVVAEHWFRQLRIRHKTLLVWHYANSPKPRGRWRGSMQAIIYGYKSLDSTFNEDEARVPYTPAAQKLNGRLRPSNGRMTKAMAYDTSKGALPRDVILHPALLGHLSSERVGHRDQKPFGLIRKLVLTSSNRGDLVLDPFAGSGTTLVAAKATGRKAIGIERAAKWVPRIAERVQSA